MKNYTIAVAGTGYVGLSIATLLSQNHKVYAVDIVPEKVELINNRKSPIQDISLKHGLFHRQINVLLLRTMLFRQYLFLDFARSY